MKEHEPGCPRLLAWDHGEFEAPCTCAFDDAIDAMDAIDPIARLRAENASLQAQVERLKAKIGQFWEALEWCSGSADFNEGGVARSGWIRFCAPLIDAWLPHKRAAAPPPPVDGPDAGEDKR